MSHFDKSLTLKPVGLLLSGTINYHPFIFTFTRVLELINKSFEQMKDWLSIFLKTF